MPASDPALPRACQGSDPADPLIMSKPRASGWRRTLLGGGDGADEVVAGGFGARPQARVRERHHERLADIVSEPQVAVAHAEHDGGASRPHALRRQAAAAVCRVVDRALQRCQRDHLQGSFARRCQCCSRMLIYYVSGVASPWLCSPGGYVDACDMS